MKEIILASASERRSRILSECSIDHKVLASGVEEKHPKDTPVSQVVQMNARVKAEAVAGDLEQAVVVGADTLVVHGKEVIGKPESKEAALSLLEKYSGSKVEVYTGVCVIDTFSGRKASGYEKSSLYTVPLSEKEAERFFDHMAPYDKAGGFSVEGIGSMLFDDIEGSYYNILGLPMIKLKELFAQAGLDILEYVKSDQ